MAVAAHELEHLSEPLKIRIARLSGIVSVVTIGLLPAAIRSDKMWLVLGLALVAYVISKKAKELHKRMEVAADAGAQSEQADPVYASALEKIHEASLIPAVLYSNTSYPHLYDRMLTAGVQPGFPRPGSPNRWIGMIVSLAITVIYYALWYWLTDIATAAWRVWWPDWS